MDNFTNGNRNIISAIKGTVEITQGGVYSSAGGNKITAQNLILKDNQGIRAIAGARNDITLSASDITLGDIEASGGASAINKLTFSATGASGNTITLGNLTARGNLQSGISNQNIITATSFAGKLSIASLTTTGGSSVDQYDGATSKNSINVSAGILEVKDGNIIADCGSNIISAKNFAGAYNIKTQGGSSSYNHITLLDTNNINLGDVIAGGQYNTKSKNTIIADKITQDNTLTLKSLSASSGDATGNSNDISVTLGILKITNSGISASSGAKNKIVANKLSFALNGTQKYDITAENQGQNDITVNNAFENVGDIIAKGGTQASNTILFKIGGATNIDLGTIKFGGNGNAEHTNTITVNNGTTDYTGIVTVTDITSFNTSGGAPKTGINKLELGKGTLQLNSNNLTANIGTQNIINAANFVGSTSTRGNNAVSITAQGGYTQENIITLSGDTNVVFGDVLAKGNGTNKNQIELTGAANLTINSISATGGAKSINQITLATGGLTIATQGIRASQGKNEITVAGNLELSDSADIYSDAGNNILQASNLILHGGGIVTTNNGYTSQNTITISDASGTIEASKIYVGGNANTTSSNTINTQGNLTLAGTIEANNTNYLVAGSNLNTNNISVAKALIVNKDVLDNKNNANKLEQLSHTAIKSYVSGNTINAGEGSAIYGHIQAYGSSVARNNIKITDQADKVNLVGNIITENGATNNLIFTGGTWAPNMIIDNTTGAETAFEQASVSTGKIIAMEQQILFLDKMHHQQHSKTKPQYLA